MNKINKTILDLNGCKSLGDLHERIKEAFHFPDWYGRNWPAFWDLINDLPEEYADIEIKGLSKLPSDLQVSGEKMIEIMQRNKQENEETRKNNLEYDYRFDYKIID